MRRRRGSGMKPAKTLVGLLSCFVLVGTVTGFLSRTKMPSMAGRSLRRLEAFRLCSIPKSDPRTDTPRVDEVRPVAPTNIQGFTKAIRRIAAATAPLAVLVTQFVMPFAGGGMMVDQPHAGFGAPANAATAREMPLSRLGSVRTYWEAVNSDDTQRVYETNRIFARMVWTTVAMNFYDPRGGASFGEQDPEWGRVWEEVERRGARPGAAGFQTAEGTRDILKYMISQLHDDYSTYLSPSEFASQFSRPRKRWAAGNEADGGERGTKGAKAVASVGMVLEPTGYCPSITTPATTKPMAGEVSSPSSWRNYHYQHYTKRPCAVVAGVLPGSPAEVAGIKMGDRIAKIGWVNTENAAGWDTTDGSFENRMLQGQEGSSVTVEVIRGDGRGGERREPVELRRRSFTSRKYPPLRVSTLVDAQGKKVAYVRLHKFDRQATQLLQSVLLAEEAVGVESYVIDLRNNLGGILQEALLAASLLIPDPNAVLCYTMDSWGRYHPHRAQEYVPMAYPGRNQDPYVAQSKALLLPPDRPIVILVNQGSASSAEAFAAALHDNGRAVMVGERTFGKSLIQHLFPMPDGGALKLTIAEYLTPKQRHLARVHLPVGPVGFSKSLTTFNWGLEPDIHVSDPSPRPNLLDDAALTQALDLLVQMQTTNQPLTAYIRPSTTLTPPPAAAASTSIPPESTTTRTAATAPSTTIASVRDGTR